MGYPITLAIRYLRSKKRAFISVGTSFAMLGVTLGVAALSIVMSVTGGFQEQFREKVLGVNAHVLVLKYSIDFREYRDIMKKVENVKGVIGVAPFVINPMMVTHGERTATGVLLKGVDPELMPSVLDLPKHVIEGSLAGMRKSDAKPPEKPSEGNRFDVNDPLFDLDAGMSEAGTSFLNSLRKQLEEDEADAGASADAKAVHAAALPPDDDTEKDEKKEKAAETPPPGAPVGAVTPTGGFKSALPDDDVLPDDIDPDPCKSPGQVARLPGVVVGKTLAKQLSVGIGDCLQITSPTIGISIGTSGMRPPVAKQFRVIAIFEAGFDQYDSKLVYTDLYEAQAFYDQGDSVTGVEMKVSDIDDARAIGEQIDQILSNGVYYTMDWKKLNHGLFTALLIQKIGMSIVLASIIVLAAFTVVATLIMVVLDKKKEVALLKALGARDDAILRVFLYQGGIIGVVGTTIGLSIGYACCRGLVVYAFPLDPKVYFISHLPVEIRPIEFALTGVLAILICLVASAFPAMYAAFLRPADGLRSE